MITSDLVSYIKKQIKNNKSKDLIVSKLLGAGWHQDDIEEGFLNVGGEPILEKNAIEDKKENLNLEVFNAELPGGQITKMEEVKKSEPKVWTPMKAVVKESTKMENEDLMPPLIPKIAVFPTNSNKAIPTPTPTPTPLSTPTPTTTEDQEHKKYLINDLPRAAMISSFESDSMTANIERQEIVQKKKVKLLKWLIPILLIVGLFAIWFFARDYIKNIKIPFIIKDPKTVLLNNSKTLLLLKAYKTETSIEVSSPSFSNISLGLLSGEAVSSIEKDSFSIKTTGIINQDENGLLSDNQITIKSSLLPDQITSDIKNNGTDLFVYLTDLSPILKENSPTPMTVKINEQQFNLIPSLFSTKTEEQLTKLNIYNILSNGIPSFINKDTLGVYDDFINNVEIIKKGEEEIKGITTYHYSIDPDRVLAKKLLSKVADNFVLNLSGEDQNKLSDILGSTTVTSFEVWVGKADNNVYQYNVALDIPLSKIIGFDDKSIGDNKLNINWKTTYYDFNIANKVSVPVEFISAEDFVKNMKEIKLKNDVSSFKQLATNLFKIEGNFGSTSNTKGSCMTPTSGSLFSPLGHQTKSTEAVSNISTLLNKVLGSTFNTGFCYSTPKDWSFAIPISDNYDPTLPNAGEYKSYYCIDSTGATKDLINPPISVVCQ